MSSLGTTTEEGIGVTGLHIKLLRMGVADINPEQVFQSGRVVFGTDQATFPKIISFKAGDNVTPYLDLQELLYTPNGILSGLAASLFVGNSISIAPGIWQIDGIKYTTVSPTPFALSTPDSSLGRYNVVYGDNTGTLNLLIGELSDTPLEPSIPNGTIKISSVLIPPPPGTVTIINPPPTGFVDLTTNQTIDGIKTFIQSPQIPLAVNPFDAVPLSQLNSIIDEWWKPGSLTGTGIETDAYDVAVSNGISVMPDGSKGLGGNLNAASTTFTDTTKSAGFGYGASYLTAGLGLYGDNYIPSWGDIKILQKYKGTYSGPTTTLQGDAYFINAQQGIASATGVVTTGLINAGLTTTALFSHFNSDASNILSWQNWKTANTQWVTNGVQELHLNMVMRRDVNLSTLPLISFPTATNFNLGDWLEFTITPQSPAPHDGSYTLHYRWEYSDDVGSVTSWRELVPYRATSNNIIDSNGSGTLWRLHIDFLRYIAGQTIEFRARQELVSGSLHIGQAQPLQFYVDVKRGNTRHLQPLPVGPSKYWEILNNSIDPNTILANWNGTDTGTIAVAPGYVSSIGDNLYDSTGTPFLKTGGGGGTWGSITGTLSSQTDLQTALNGKQASGTYVTSITIASANGISGSSSGGATPALTLTLGAITPSSTNGVSAATMAFVDPTSSIQTQLNSKLAIGGGTMTGFLILNADPTSALHAATKSYVDNLITGITWKQEVRAGTTANITLSGAQTIDGVSVIAGDRVLVKNQTSQIDNGIYLAASGGWTRTADADSGAEIGSATVLIRNGTVNKDTQWTCTNSVDPVIGVDNIAFGQISGAGTYTNGTGISLTGNVFSINASYVSTSSITGYLLSTDWTTFNNKQAALGGTGFVKSTAGTISYDTSTYITGNQSITLSSEVTGVGTTAITTTIDKTISPTWTGPHTYTVTGVGTTQTNRIILKTADVATSGNQKVSPSIEFDGDGFMTTGSTREVVGMRIQFLPTQGTTTNTGSLNFDRNIGGTYASNIFQIDTNGAVTASGTGTFNSGVIVGGGPFNTINSNIYIGSIAGGSHSSTTALLWGGASDVGYRNVFGNGSTSFPNVVTNNFSNALFVSAIFQSASSGVHAYASNVTIQAPTIQLLGTGTVTVGSALHIDGPSVNAATNYSLYVRTGASYFGGSISHDISGIATTSTLGVSIANNTLSTSGVPSQISAGLDFVNHVWNTTATAADNVGQFRWEARGISGTTPVDILWLRGGLAASSPTLADTMGMTTTGHLGIGISGGYNAFLWSSTLNIGGSIGIWDSSNTYGLSITPQSTGTRFVNPNTGVGLQMLNNTIKAGGSLSAAIGANLHAVTGDNTSATVGLLVQNSALADLLRITGDGNSVFSSSSAAASGITSLFAIKPTYNQTSTAGATDLVINRTETAIGSGVHKFLSLQIAATEAFAIDRTGKILVTTGTNKSAGSATLSAGTVTVSTTAVTASSIILIMYKGGSISGTIGVLSPGTVTAGTSFVINSLVAGTASTVNVADNSVVNWWFLN